MENKATTSEAVDCRQEPYTYDFGYADAREILAAGDNWRHYMDLHGSGGWSDEHWRGFMDGVEAHDPTYKGDS